MKRIILACCCCIFYLSARSQTITTVHRAPLDTDIVAYDEQGKEMRYYQYIKLLNTGQYKLISKGAPGTKAVSYIVKVNPQENARLYALIKERTAIKSPKLREDSTLDIKPLLGKVKKSELDNKVIVLVFWDTNCPPCTDSFSDINDFFDQLPNKDNVVLIAITPDDESLVKDKLKQKPLKYARFENDAMGTISTYQIENYPAYVVTDKKHVIRYATSGSSPLTMTMLKNSINEVLK